MIGALVTLLLAAVFLGGMLIVTVHFIMSPPQVPF